MLTGRVDPLFILSFLFLLRSFTIHFISLKVVVFSSNGRGQVKQWTMICIVRGWLDLLLDVLRIYGMGDWNYG